MARWFAWLAFWSAIGCSPAISTSGSDASASTQANSATGDAGAAMLGADCFVDNVGVELCAAISGCPDVVVDRSTFPHCGFRVRGSAIDLECSCYGELCPMGVATSCTEAAKLLGSQYEASVCAQVQEGRCTTPRATPTTQTPSSCDRACAAECSGSGTCLKLCGC